MFYVDHFLSSLQWLTFEGTPLVCQVSDQKSKTKHASQKRVFGISVDFVAVTIFHRTNVQAVGVGCQFESFRLGTGSFYIFPIGFAERSLHCIVVNERMNSFTMYSCGFYTRSDFSLLRNDVKETIGPFNCLHASALIRQKEILNFALKTAKRIIPNFGIKWTIFIGSPNWFLISE